MALARAGVELYAKDKATRTLSKFDNALGKTGRTFRNLAASVGVGLGLYQVVNTLKDSIQEFAKFEQGLANVSTMLDESTMHYMPKYEKAISKMAVKYGESTESLTKGLYDVLSASIDASKAIDVLEVAVKLGKAGLAETAITADALTTVINAYQFAAEDASKVSDQMFATIRKGKIIVEEYASSIGKVATIAAKAGLTFPELNAAIATLTRSGIDADQAMTAMKGILTKFSKATPEAAKAAREFGFELNTTTLREIGLIGVMKKLKHASMEQLSAIFGNVRGLLGMVAVLGDAIKYEEDLKDITESYGQTLIALNKNLATTSTKISQMSEAWKQVKRTIGEALAPVMLEYLKDWQRGFRLLSDDLDRFINKALIFYNKFLLIIKKVELAIAKIEITGILDEEAVKNEIKALEKTINALENVKTTTGKVEEQQELLNKAINKTVDLKGRDISSMQVWAAEAEKVKAAIAKRKALRDKELESANKIIKSIKEEVAATLLLASGRAKSAMVAKNLLITKEEYLKNAKDIVEIEKILGKTTEAGIAYLEEYDKWQVELTRVERWVTLGKSMESSISDAFSRMIFEGAKFKDVMGNIAQAIVEEFIKIQFIQPFAQMMAAGVTRLGMGLLGSAFGAVPSVQAGVGHTGGEISSLPIKRVVPAALFVNAPRYHGLRPGEEAIIAQRGERISRGEPNVPVVNINLNAIDTQSGVQFLAKNKRLLAGLIQNEMKLNHPTRRGE